MDLHAALERLTASVEQARAVPMSASALVNRDEVLGLLDDVRAQLPAALDDAQRLLRDRDAHLARAREQAEQILADAAAERDRLVDGSAVMAAARERAADLHRAAQQESQRLLTQADDYVDTKLRSFEAALDEIGQQVARGRAHLAERRASGPPQEPAVEPPDTDPPQAELVAAAPDRAQGRR